MDERRAELIVERNKRIEAVRDKMIQKFQKKRILIVQGETVEDDEVEQTLAAEFPVNEKRKQIDCVSTFVLAR